MTELDVEAIYAKLGPMVRRRCRRILRDEGAAEDAMQEVFIKLLRYAPRFDVERLRANDDQGLRKLLSVMATNAALNMRRSRLRRRESASDDASALIDAIATAPDTVADVARKVWWETLLGSIAATTRTVAVMHYVDGMTLEEVARETRLSVAGVRKRLDKLKAAVRVREGVPT